MKKVWGHMHRQYGKTLALLNMVATSIGTSVGAVVQHVAEASECRIDWRRQEGRDLSLTLSDLLAPA